MFLSYDRCASEFEAVDFVSWQFCDGIEPRLKAFQLVDHCDTRYISLPAIAREIWRQNQSLGLFYVTSPIKKIEQDPGTELKSGILSIFYDEISKPVYVRCTVFFTYWYTKFQRGVSWVENWLMVGLRTDAWVSIAELWLAVGIEH